VTLLGPHCSKESPTVYLTFDEITQRVAAFHAEQNAPAAVACRALEALRAALDACAPGERREIVQLVRDELGLTA
jgi:hypothetical protein